MSNLWWGGVSKYSTEERVVGEWIDGKPIYQKTLLIDALTDTSSLKYKYQSVDASIALVIKVDSVACSDNANQPNWIGTVPAMFDTSNYIYVGVQTNSASSNKNSIQIAYKGSNSWVKKLIVTVQYTKTTD